MRHDDDRLRALMLAGLAGDGAAHAALLRALLVPLRSFFRRRLGGRDDDIEDLVQDVLIAVHQRRATYDPERPFGAWVYPMSIACSIPSLKNRPPCCAPRASMASAPPRRPNGWASVNPTSRFPHIAD